MVQIKKKVTLKAKTEQKPVAEPVKQQSPQTTLPKTTPTPLHPAGGSENGGKKRSNKVLVGIAILVLLCAVGYGAYTLLTPSSNDDGTATTVQVNKENNVEGEGDISSAKNDDVTNIPETEVAPSTDITDGVESPTTEGDIPASETPETQVKPEKRQPANTADPVKKAEIKSTSQSSSKSHKESVPGTLEQQAIDVIRGSYGNGEERKQKLGDQYSEIQKKVNEMYRNGLVK